MERSEKINTLAFIDSKIQAIDYVKYMRDGLAITTDLSSFIYLRKRNMSVCNTLDYFQNVSHENILKKSKDIVKWLEDNVSFVDIEIGINQAYLTSLIFYTRLIVHHYLWCIEIATNAIKKHMPKLLMASYNPRHVRELYVHPDEDCLGYIVQNIAEINRLGFKNIHRNRLRFLKHFRWKRSILWYLIKYAFFHFWKIALLLKLRNDKHRWIVCTTDNNLILDTLEKEMPEKRYSILIKPIVAQFKMPDCLIKMFWSRYKKKIDEQRRMFEGLAEKIERQDALFSYQGVSFAALLARKLKASIFDYVLGEILWSIDLDRLFNTLKPFCIIGTGERLDDITLAELGTHKEIPTILISHGSLTRIKNEYEMIEWGEQGKTLLRAPFSRISLQTPLAEEYLKTFPIKGLAMRTGPIAWGRSISCMKNEQLFNRLFKGKFDMNKTKVVVHAGTPKANNILRPFVYETLDEYIKALCEIARVIEEDRENLLIIRLPKSCGIPITAIRDLVPLSDKVVLSSKEKFLDILNLADLLISFSSTTIEEALQNHIPVLLYGGEGRYSHIPACEIRHGDEVVSKAVYHVTRAEDLRYAIQKILDLNISDKENAHLFNPYIYAEDARESLVKLINANCTKEGSLVS